ncbi:hypothetical protein FGU46_10445 [Methanobacterium sp. CWC-01]|uniref:hypothetical protein n=1 Tax=Methanobacterium aridiramus TaxID=2584467 RepID=UPI0025761B2D|nr:hypothetical protein [Methanobacterium sp. CWC-01]WJI10478.1 hypothetical protein FGU46_10445 [Methanobacterium sp. CWC-01]
MVKRFTKEIWFRKRRLGWGFSPVTWQGWLVTLILVLILILDAMYLYKSTLFGIILVVAIIGYIILAFLTSEYLSYSSDNDEGMV